jgi:hypothetical protein
MLLGLCFISLWQTANISNINESTKGGEGGREMEEMGGGGGGGLLNKDGHL